MVSVLFIIVLVLLGGCARKPINSSLPVEIPDSFSITGSSELPSKWWTEFNDSALNVALDTALASNFTIKTAWQRLIAAQAVVDRESSAFFPGIFSSIRGESGSGQSSFEVDNNLRLDLTAEYEIDLWGRIRSAVDAERYRADATLTEFETAAITLSAEFVITWYRLSEARMQHTIAIEQTRTNEKVLNLLRARFGTGQIRSVDILRQNRLLEASREEVLLREAEIRLLENRLAVLTGNPPQKTVKPPDINFPVIHPLPQTGIPLELVRRRPDIKTAFYKLQAADRDLASAMSSRYPRLSVSADWSTVLKADDLFQQWAFSISGNLLAPLFQWGRLKAEVDRNKAVRNQRAYEYGEAVLTAFRETEDALIREINQVKRIKNIENQHKLAKQAYEQLRIEFFNGISNYLDVLTALEQEQQLLRELTTEQRKLIEYRVGLYKALAGGFITTEEEISEKGL